MASEPADVELIREILAGRVGQRVKQVAAGDEVVAQFPDLRAQRIRRDQTADVFITNDSDRLKHINILADVGRRRCR